MPTDRFCDTVATECLTCRFWEPEEEQEEPTLGECRRREAADGPASGRREDPRPMAWLPRLGWPLTDGRDWCEAWRRAA